MNQPVSRAAIIPVRKATDMNALAVGGMPTARLTACLVPSSNVFLIA
jgi:hypothetical protein